MNPYRVLAIDGGGIRGVIPAQVLQALESRCGPVAEHFDAIAGTSTGGIIALGLSDRGDGDRPRYSATDMLDFYLENGATIFPHHSPLHRVADIVEPKYSAEPLERVLHGHFGDRMLSDALTEVVIPSYDISGPAPCFFKREYARAVDEQQNRYQDVPIRQVARATSAAPTYFAPAKLRLTAGGREQALVDGGTFANNPAVAAYADALRWAREQGRDGLVVVSIGTGQPPQTPGHGPIPISATGWHTWGLAEWAIPILEVALDGAAKAVEYQMRQIEHSGDGRLRYFRLQSPLPTASHALDDASPENLTRLRADALQLIDDNAAKLDEICAAVSGR